MKLGLILSLALILRLIGINQSLWLDEAITAQVTRGTPKEIVTNFSVADFHPPLYYWLMSGWSKVAGRSETALRMPSVFFGLVTVAVIFRMYGGWAGLLSAVNPLLIYYSQEARMYSMATMLFVLAWWAIRKEKWIWVNLFSGLALGTFYGIGLGWAGINIYWMLTKKYNNIFRGNWGIFTMLLALTPLLRWQIKAAGSQLNEAASWVNALGKTNIKNLALIPLKFAIGRVSFYPKLAYYFVGGAWTAIVGWTARKSINRTELIVAGLTIIIGMTVSYKIPMMQYFRFIYLLPLLVAVLPKKWWLAVGFSLWSLFYVLNPQQHREDWKRATADLKNKEVYMINTFGDPVNYYRPEIQVKDIREKIEGKTVEVMPYGEAIHGVDHGQLLTNSGYKLTKQSNFRQMMVETWEKELKEIKEVKQESDD